MTRVNYNSDYLSVGLLKKLLEQYPDNLRIGFLYENWEEPSEVKIGYGQYEGRGVLYFEMKDDEVEVK